MTALHFGSNPGGGAAETPSDADGAPLTGTECEQPVTVIAATPIVARRIRCLILVVPRKRKSAGGKEYAFLRRL
jgi:hypothetical protein